MKRKLKIIIFIGIVLAIAILAVIYIPKYFGSILYPLDYRAEIRQSAQEFGLNPNFIAGVIFTESRFNAKATSRVGALGLMQIMPPTARGIAQALGDNDFAPAKLYEPARSIRYGSYYLHSLLDKYNQNENLVLMHYNGGGGAVQRFQSGGITNIPRETQGFVRKVKSTRDMYNQIYGEWWQSEPFTKPEAQTFAPNVTNIREFWRVLITPQETAP